MVTLFEIFHLVLCKFFFPVNHVLLLGCSRSCGVNYLAFIPRCQHLISNSLQCMLCVLLFEGRIKMNKFNVDVRQVNAPKVTADIDWSLLKDDQTTRALIEHWQKEHEYRQMAMMGVWDTPRMNTDDFLSGLNPRVMEDNPLAELLKGLLERVDRREGPFSWFWGYDWDGYRRESLDKRFLARLIANENVCDDEICEISKDTPMAQFNEAMDLFYDWCDSSSVWVDK
ncbi:hypothetical protein GECvBMG_gp260 [Salmonella phage GEC_vB_MG]|nr:hypothetical protein GECvBMG_gp260 [Salmonella phage GEC_vB_MG]